MAWSTNLFIVAVCAPLGGWLVDRYGTKKILMLSAIMSTLGTGIVVLGHHPIVFLLDTVLSLVWQVLGRRRIIY